MIVHVDTKLLDYRVRCCQWILRDLALIHPVDSVITHNSIAAGFFWNVQSQFIQNRELSI